MSSSGLIYAAIVGAWAAYLVPMWLRREDERNEVRATQRYVAAIRMLSRRREFEKRYAATAADASSDSAPASASASGTRAAAPRGQALARRRRVVLLLFATFTLGSIGDLAMRARGHSGLSFAWAPAIPAILLSVYIVHMRHMERSRLAERLRRREAVERRRTREAAAARRAGEALAAASFDAPEYQPAAAAAGGGRAARTAERSGRARGARTIRRAAAYAEEYAPRAVNE